MPSPGFESRKGDAEIMCCRAIGRRFPDRQFDALRRENNGRIRIHLSRRIERDAPPQRREEVAEATLQGYHYRLNPYVQWSEQEDVMNLNELTARSLHEYRLWRKEDGELKTIILKRQLSNFRVFVKFLESIDGVDQGLHDEMLIFSGKDEDAVSNSILEA